MHIFRFETTIKKEGSLAVNGLPFSEGEKVEVMVRRQESEIKPRQKYALRGKPIRYTYPFDGVAEDDWDAIQ